MSTKKTIPNETIEADPFSLRVRYYRTRLDRLWAYDAEFLDLDTGKLFGAQWLNLEMAEHYWQVADNFLSLGLGRARSSKPKVFTLELQLWAYLPKAQKLEIRMGRPPDWKYCFQIGKCIPCKD